MQPESRVNILLVDDKPENLLALEVILADLGHTLVKAASGKEALRAVLREDFAVILLDVQMPKMDGFETAELIRERPRSAHTPILFLTALGTSEPEVFRGYSVGAVDYLIKPLVPRILRSKVAAFVELFRMREEIRRQAALLQEREREAQALAASLAAKNRDLETLLYVTSHDLREPLRGIESFARLVQERYAERLDEKGQDFLQRIVRAAERLSQLLDDVLALSRVQRMASPSGTVEAAGLLAEALHRLEAALTETGATVRVAADLPRLVAEVLGRVRAGMLCLADRLFYGYALWTRAAATGADLLWRVKQNLRLPCEQRLPDGSSLSRIYPTTKDQRHGRHGVVVRVIEYQLVGVPGAEPSYRPLTTILDPEAAPAAELAAPYHERWEMHTALDELKTHLRGARIVLRSKTPDLVKQEFYGLLLAHFAVRGLMHEAALQAGDDPDRFSFLHVLRVIRRKLPCFAALLPCGLERLACGGAPGDPG